MGSITTPDGIEIYYKDWGSGQPLVFSHGWPLSANDWDTQLMFFLEHGYRVIAADRRGHGRSTQTDTGHDMDHYADDLAAVIAHLDVQDAVHIGHSTGGGEVVRYIARHGESRVAKAVLISSVPPLMVQTEANPEGLPKSVFDDLQAPDGHPALRVLPRARVRPVLRIQPARPRAIGGDRGELVAPGDDGRRQGSLRRHRGVFADRFHRGSEQISVPVLVMHGDDDQIVPYADSGPKSAALVQNGTLKSYKGFPHGMPTTEAETINADLLTFVQE